MTTLATVVRTARGFDGERCEWDEPDYGLAGPAVRFWNPISAPAFVSDCRPGYVAPYVARDGKVPQIPPQQTILGLVPKKLLDHPGFGWIDECTILRDYDGAGDHIIVEARLQGAHDHLKWVKFPVVIEAHHAGCSVKVVTEEEDDWDTNLFRSVGGRMTHLLDDRDAFKTYAMEFRPRRARPPSSTSGAHRSGGSPESASGRS